MGIARLERLAFHRAFLARTDATSLDIRTQESGLVFGWLMTLLALIGLRLGVPPRRWSVIVPIGVLALAVLLHLWLGGRYAHETAGLFCGAMVVLLFRLGKGLVFRSPRVRPQPSRVRARSPAAHPLARSAPLFFIVLLAPHEQAEARRQAGTPIPVLLSYEGNVDPRRAPDLVVSRE